MEGTDLSAARWLGPVEHTLRDHVRRAEAALAGHDAAPDTLWDHLQRVARLSERLGAAEGLDPPLCRLAGLFHDAGKFAKGRVHGDQRPEEDRSVEILRAITQEHAVPASVVEPVAAAILQLYRDPDDPAPLARVLFDADNLDKLGPLGVANFFIKIGLRGGGVSRRSLFRLTVELTYASYAAACMHTATGRDLARRRAAATSRFLHDLLDTLRADGLHDFTVRQVRYKDLELEVVEPRSCTCGHRLARRVWDEQGLKCTEIHLEHACATCGERHELRFCRPRLVGPCR
jgi:HD superfamily phosphodiesterase